MEAGEVPSRIWLSTRPGSITKNMEQLAWVGNTPASSLAAGLEEQDDIQVMGDLQEQSRK